MQSMSSLPDTRQQSFDEIYGPPENFLEIEVCNPPPSPVCPTALGLMRCRVTTLLDHADHANRESYAYPKAQARR